MRPTCKIGTAFFGLQCVCLKVETETECTACECVCPISQGFTDTTARPQNYHQCSRSHLPKSSSTRTCSPLLSLMLTHKCKRGAKWPSLTILTGGPGYKLSNVLNFCQSFRSLTSLFSLSHIRTQTNICCWFVGP